LLKYIWKLKVIICAYVKQGRSENVLWHAQRHHQNTLQSHLTCMKIKKRVKFMIVTLQKQTNKLGNKQTNKHISTKKCTFTV
jgi:hypothetical protein